MEEITQVACESCGVTIPTEKAEDKKDCAGNWFILCPDCADNW